MHILFLTEEKLTEQNDISGAVGLMRVEDWAGQQFTQCPRGEMFRSQCRCCICRWQQQISSACYSSLNGKQCPYFALTASNREIRYNFPSVLTKFTLSVIIPGNLKQNSSRLCVWYSQHFVCRLRDMSAKHANLTSKARFESWRAWTL
jgi:hypothetical protein